MFPDLYTAAQSMYVVGVSCIMATLGSAKHKRFAILLGHDCKEFRYAHSFSRCLKNMQLVNLLISLTLTSVAIMGMKETQEFPNT